MSQRQTEIPVLIPCEEDTLVGIVHKPENAGKVGVVVVVAGGPQYRVGAHRQFVTLSRMLANEGVGVIRFDHRGTGDSTGEIRGFIDMNADIQCAIDTLCEQVPEIELIVLWGECESATSSAFYAYTDKRVQGILMVNPWIRTEQGQAKTIIKHYYWNRLFEKSFWLKIKSGQFSAFNSLKSYFQLRKSAGSEVSPSTDSEQELASLPLPSRLAKSCVRFHGKIFVLTSGNDLIAQEYKDYVESSDVWQDMIASNKVVVHDIPDSDHTFSRLEWRDELFDNTKNWIVSFLEGTSKKSDF